MHCVPVQEYKIQVLTRTHHFLVPLDVDINQFVLLVNLTLGETPMVRMIWWVIDTEPFSFVVRLQRDVVIALGCGKGIAQGRSFDPDACGTRPLARLKVK